MSTYVTAIDFGSGKIALAVGEKQQGRIRVVHCESAPSAGIRYGEILNDYQVCQILTPMIRRAERAIGETISSAVVNLTGKFVSAEETTLRDKHRDANRRIVSEDIRKMISEAYSAPNSETVVLEASPLSFDVDDQYGLSRREVEGIRSGLLAGSFKRFTGRRQLLDKRKAVLSECELSLRKAVFSPVASARAALTPQELDNGVALVDIGKELTEVVIVKENIVREAFVIPFGGEAITNDIKNITNFTATWAEAVKIGTGSCIEEQVADNRTVELTGEEGNVEGSVELLLLTRVIEARMSEILDAVKYLIDGSRYAERIPAGVVFTGGGAYLENLPALAGAILGRKVRLAAPRSTIAEDSAKAAGDMYASTVVGLLLEFYEPTLSTTQSTPQKAENSLGSKLFAPASVAARESQPLINGTVMDEQQKNEPQAETPRKEEPGRKEARKSRNEGAGDKKPKFLGGLFDDLFGTNNAGNEA